MKQINLIVGLIVAVSLSFYSCDKIENPIPATFGDLDWSLSPDRKSVV